jgi:glycosyltransferase involved in cell wall biosynthesis
MKTAVFSIISPNYRYRARLLMESLRTHQPEWERFVLIVGDTSDSGDRETSFTAIPIDDLRLPNARQFYFRYTLLELNTAAKPWMFELLFARGFDRVVYLDPDIVVYSPLTEIDHAAPETFLVLTPHLTGFIRGENHPSERSILQAGTFNLGFLAVTRQPSLGRFLSWWQEKLEFQCIVAPERGIFVDQKWMDLAPSLFPDVSILRHEGYNVAYWNLEHRQVAEEGGGATVNGQLLRFVHFSGFDPDTPREVSRHVMGMKVEDLGDAAALFSNYADVLRAARTQSSRSAPYSFGVFNDGSPIPDAARIAYRNDPTLQAACGADPFAHAERFRGLVDRPRNARAAKVAAETYTLLSRARPLVRLMPRRMRVAMREFLLGRRDVMPAAARAESPLPPGLNVAGYVTRDTGVGESARLCASACDTAAVPSHLIDVDSSDGLAKQAVYRATIYHVNAEQVPQVYGEIQHVFASSAYNIGCWHWELPELPDAWITSAEPFDEIWAPSAFIQSAISAKVTIPVVHMPHGIDVANSERCCPEELGVPNGRFTFLCMFDLSSILARKNPEGAVEAFRRAFPSEPAPALLVKVSHAQAHPEAYAALVERLRGIPNVYVTDRMLSRARVNGLLASVDGVLSLHRSEGFGLILAEAMSLGKPVVATGWSGNMDFMNTGNSCPVAYELVALDRDHLSYRAGQTWAEPDIDHAAYLLQRVVENADYRNRIGDRARVTIRTHFTPAAAGRRYQQRLVRLGLMDRFKVPPHARDSVTR